MRRFECRGTRRPARSSSPKHHSIRVSHDEAAPPYVPETTSETRHSDVSPSGGVALVTDIPDTGRLGWRAALQAELHRAFTSPFEAPVVVLVNGLLVTGAWFLFPSDSVFRIHAAWFFPLALASWMLSDVPATNVLGSDSARM